MSLTFLKNPIPHQTDHYMGMEKWDSRSLVRKKFNNKASPEGFIE